LKPLLTDEHLNTLTTKKDFHIPPFLPFGSGTAEPPTGWRTGGKHSTNSEKKSFLWQNPEGIKHE
jgi:hypothetical protein